MLYGDYPEQILLGKKEKKEKAVSNGIASNASSCDSEGLSDGGRKAFVVSEAMYKRPSQEH